METALYLVAGGLVLAITFADILWTTLWPDGAAGPVARPVASTAWRVLRRAGPTHPRTLSLGGPLAVVATLGTWLLLILVGWLLVFSAEPDSIRHAGAADGISAADRLWFVAYTIFTLGNGDFSPNGAPWQIATSIAVASGMVTVTLAVTYVLSVVGAVTGRRRFASSVRGLGQSPETILERAWDGHDVSRLSLPLNGLASELSELSDNHLAFPVLHFYRPQKSEKSSALAVAVLDDTLTVLEHGFAGPYANASVLAAARASVDDYLDTLGSAFIAPAEEDPPPVDVLRLARCGLPVLGPDEFAARTQHLRQRRRLLLAAVEADAWSWPGADPDEP